mmetsp:Transcript_4780/g.11930  ORF Transcript_4780/g.11930 Transcript_4780/m.11930 type:complete len:745 (-) Transcript_4780:40-2274(-)
MPNSEAVMPPTSSSSSSAATTADATSSMSSLSNRKTSPAPASEAIPIPRSENVRHSAGNCVSSPVESPSAASSPMPASGESTPDGDEGLTFPLQADDDAREDGNDNNDDGGPDNEKTPTDATVGKNESALQSKFESLSAPTPIPTPNNTPTQPSSMSGGSSTSSSSVYKVKRSHYITPDAHALQLGTAVSRLALSSPAGLTSGSSPTSTSSPPERTLGKPSPGPAVARSPSANTHNSSRGRSDSGRRSSMPTVSSSSPASDSHSVVKDEQPRSVVTFRKGDRATAENFLQMGIAAHKERKTQAALQCFDMAINEDPSFLEARYIRGTIHLELRDFKIAVEDFSNCLLIDPDHQKSYLSRALAYKSRGSLHNAIQDLSTLLRKAPTLKTAYMQRAELYVDVGKFDKAHSDYLEALFLAESAVQRNEVRSKLASTMKAALSGARVPSPEENSSEENKYDPFPEAIRANLSVLKSKVEDLSWAGSPCPDLLTMISAMRQHNEDRKYQLLCLTGRALVEAIVDQLLQGHTVLTEETALSAKLNELKTRVPQPSHINPFYELKEIGNRASHTGEMSPDDANHLTSALSRVLNVYTAFLLQRYKTKLCRHWRAGLCKRGDNCSFAHGDEQLRVSQFVAASRRASAPSVFGFGPNGPLSPAAAAAAQKRFSHSSSGAMSTTGATSPRSSFASPPRRNSTAVAHGSRTAVSSSPSPAHSAQHLPRYDRRQSVPTSRTNTFSPISISPPSSTK